MSFVSDVITRAYRESNIVPIGATPTDNEFTEALPLLNSVILSALGNEAGDKLQDLNIGGNLDQSSSVSTSVPPNVRLVLNMASADELLLDPLPSDGERLGVSDAGQGLATYNLTLNGNGRLIEGASSLTLSTAGLNRQWMYRADLGEWVVMSSLLVGDVMPFPQEFDDYFITMLAVRLNPRNSVATAPETAEVLKRYRSRLRSRYDSAKFVEPDITLLGGLSDPRGVYQLSDPDSSPSVTASPDR